MTICKYVSIENETRKIIFVIWVYITNEQKNEIGKTLKLMYISKILYSIQLFCNELFENRLVCINCVT